ncbi:hypothetical protein [Hoeflea ulvae]|uniref:Twin-arginine translocation signal domain-containing protein n=1 Tax=Hoeflea ulvae TaxID=2983764 RepID=A0ABT3YC24_9HYPH|nr:hypothetical protein [Hoeflea ulvae]MCY0093344.1 hypothetical protein [Hoeflea ulvae]
MLVTFLKKLMASSESKTTAQAALSRRKFILGAGAAFGSVYIASQLGVSHVQASPAAGSTGVELDDDLINLAQFRDERNRRNDRGGRDDRGRGRDDRGGRRTSRRDLERQCRQSNRFRRDNRELCRRVSGRSFGRSGTCIQFGPLQVCE